MHYFNIGAVRGSCGHKHRTLSGAARCLKNDQIGCKRQAGYSDRITKIKENGESYDLSREEFELQDLIHDLQQKGLGLASLYPFVV